jgi:hypothetical protein
MKSVLPAFGYLLVFGVVVGAIWLRYPPQHSQQRGLPIAASERAPLSSDAEVRRFVSHSLNH